MKLTINQILLKNRKQNHVLFLQRALDIHGNLFDYSNVIYVNSKTPIIICCREHGNFSQTPDAHLRTYNIKNHKNTGGCPICAQASRKETKRKTTPMFISEANLIHQNKYTYKHVVYKNTHTKILITCSIHGNFSMTPKDHLTGKQGCRYCAHKKAFSGKALRWLTQIEQSKGIRLQHANNGGEFSIPTTRFKADGYCIKTNTIYEFYGDKFHGNPDKYSSTEYCHPFNKKLTAGELYNMTMQRENTLRALGYNVVTIWEHEFKE